MRGLVAAGATARDPTLAPTTTTAPGASADGIGGTAGTDRGSALGWALVDTWTLTRRTLRHWARPVRRYRHLSR